MTIRDVQLLVSDPVDGPIIGSRVTVMISQPATVATTGAVVVSPDSDVTDGAGIARFRLYANDDLLPLGTSYAIQCELFAVRFVVPSGAYGNHAGHFDVLTDLMNLPPVVIPSVPTHTFVWDQNVPASTWVIDHALLRMPAVSIVDSTYEEVEADITYNSNSRITVQFVAANGGHAYLS